MTTASWTLLALVTLFVAWRVLRARALSNRVTPMREDEPWLLVAVQRARESFAEMQALVRGGKQVAVKFPLANGAGDIEHVWGGVSATDDEGAEVVILTPLLVGETPQGPQRVGRGQLEDWQAFLDDGTIRGGFTTQAQLAVCRRENLRIPRALLDQDARFLDRIHFPPLDKTP